MRLHFLASAIFCLAASCSTSGDVKAPDDSAWLARLAERDACMGAYRERIAAALDGRLAAGSADEIREMIWSALPADEKEILIDVSREIPRGRPEFTEELRIEIIEEAEEAFREKRICGNADALNDMYLFAEAVNAYIRRNGLWTDQLFQTAWEADQGMDPGQRTLLSLVLQAASKGSQRTEER